MLRIVCEVWGEVDDAKGVKERLAMELEKYGNVRVVRVERVGDDGQMRLEG